MLYREAGQYKSSYERRPGGVPAARRTASASPRILLIAFVRRPARRQRLLAQLGDDPVPGVLARGHRAQHADRLYRPALARHRRRSWASAPMPATSSRRSFPAQHRRHDAAVGLLRGRGRRAVRPAVAAHQGLLPRGRDARRAVLPVMVLHPHAAGSTITMPPAPSRCRPARSSASPITGPTATAARPLSRGARHRRRDDLARLEPGARPHRPDPGWWCATWTSRPS